MMARDGSSHSRPRQTIPITRPSSALSGYWSYSYSGKPYNWLLDEHFSPHLTDAHNIGFYDYNEYDNNVYNDPALYKDGNATIFKGNADAGI